MQSLRRSFLPLTLAAAMLAGASHEFNAQAADANTNTVAKPKLTLTSANSNSQVPSLVKFTPKDALDHAMEFSKPKKMGIVVAKGSEKEYTGEFVVEALKRSYAKQLATLNEAYKKQNPGSPGVDVSSQHIEFFLTDQTKQPSGTSVTYVLDGVPYGTSSLNTALVMVDNYAFKLMAVRRAAGHMASVDIGNTNNVTIAALTP